MDAFVEILSKPDNLPIVGMVVALAFLLGVWARQARRNDRLLRAGRADEIAKEMRR